MHFRTKIEKTATAKNSNIILALDPPPQKPEKALRKAIEILDAVHLHICAVKFNRQMVLPLGLFGNMEKLIVKARNYGLPTIMDCKINDIGNTNRVIAEYYFKAGFDAVTANPFVGWEEGLSPVFEVAKRENRGIILLVYMSHKNSGFGYGQKVFAIETGETMHQYEVFARKALEWNADGVVVGATYPEIVQKVSLVLGEEVPVYSPGIGAQGAKVEDAVKNGAKYLIVGRSIVQAANPKQVAENLKLLAQKSILKKRLKEASQ